MDWRTKRYGRITGADLERCLAMFDSSWAERSATFGACNDQMVWERRVRKLAAIPDWTPLYEKSLIELIAMLAKVAGVEDQILAAAGSAEPAKAFLDVVESMPDDAADHPALLPLAMAMAGNLEAIARYSRTINDMMRAARERNDLGPLTQALSVDSRLVTMPFFQAALRLGQLSGDAEALDVVAQAIRGPHKKRLVYPKLRWAEYLLRDQGAFEACTQDELHELIVVHLGLYGDDGEHKDSKKALFTTFRKWRKEAGI